MRVLNEIFWVLIVYFTISCKGENAKQIENTLTKRDYELLKFIQLYSSYIDATSEWHEMKDYNMIIEFSKRFDTIEYRISGTGTKDIWPQIEHCSTSYLIEKHYIFSNTDLFSTKSLSIDSVLKSINFKQYQDYKNTKTPQPPFMWDCESLKVIYVKGQLRVVKFVWGP